LEVEDLIFIDYSSTCIAVSHYNKFTMNYRFMVMHNSLDVSKVIGFDVKSHNKIFGLEDLVEYHSFSRASHSRVKGNTHDYNIKHVKDCMMLSHNFVEKFQEFTHSVDYNTCYVGWEDYPVSIKSNSSSHVTDFTAMAKSEFFKIFPIDNTKWYQPQVIKKTAGNGNYNKRQMFDQFIGMEPESELQLFANKNKVNYYSGSKNINHPMEDLVDSYFGVKTMINEIMG